VIFVRRLVSAALFVVLLAPARPAGAESFKPFKLKAIDGTERSLADFTDRATLVVFFHPTCQYCLQALPKLQAIDDTYKDRGLKVVWINVLPEENRMLVEWQAEHKLTAPILVAQPPVQRDYRLTMTPTHYLIDARRTVLWKHAGYTPGDETTLQQEIEKALAAAR